ncbi:tryptophan--tRNA ligase [Kineosporia succinea]|uniref:Tryptophan--tRNA ligase n=1 Tax=Kineosporia succinea TaxID=84632 RepID=A0ABT9P3T3_9ACTN|nr:tryptophan--tRNA ligase [Kineosporia succinea]MDP9827328.1 tryptophanyl-tRNA synthetase [Kineosporia succinea]
MPEPGPARPRLLSGMQPTSDSLHLGNYIGALVNWVELQEQFDAYFFIADLHTITMGHDPKALRARSHRYIAQYLAAGIDPSKSVLFAQSHVPEHPRLSWVLECLTGFGEAGRMTQFKDKSSKEGTEGATVGLFTYPILQAADILLYRPALVPVGEDQRQHLELTRDLAQRFNKRFGKTFRVPEAHIVKATAKILDLQHPEKKMSGSIGGPGCLWLLDDPKVSAKKIRSAVTDTGRDIVFDPENKPGVANLLTILSVLGHEPVEALEAKFVGAGYGDLKKEVAAAYEEFAGPIAEKANALIADPDTLDDILADGAAKAQETTARVLAEVYDRVGFLPPKR